jgi:MFS family permease
MLTAPQGVLTMDAFQHSFHLVKGSHDFANLQGNIVSVLQAGCFFGAMASFYVSDTFGRKKALIIADIIFIVGSLVQTLIFGGNIAQLYVGRVIGGFGVGLISAVVPTYISENAPKEIRGRCIGCMVRLENTRNRSGAMLTVLATLQCHRYMSCLLRQLRNQPRYHLPNERS